MCFKCDNAKRLENYLNQVNQNGQLVCFMVAADKETGEVYLYSPEEISPKDIAGTMIEMGTEMNEGNAKAFKLKKKINPNLN